MSSKDGTNYVVDGQQRLTSLTLFLLLLRVLQDGRDDAVNIDELIVSEKYGQRSFNLDAQARHHYRGSFVHWMFINSLRQRTIRINWRSSFVTACIASCARAVSMPARSEIGRASCRERV